MSDREGEVGLIGIGLLGTAMANRLIAAGRDVLGYDVDASRRTALEQLGGRSAATADEVFQQRSIVILSLPTSDIAREVLDASSSYFATGQLIVDTTTGDPQAMASLGQWLAQREVAYLDATIAGSSKQAAAGDVVGMVGGPESALARCEPLLKDFCRQVFHLGDWGAGARMKLVVNLVLGLNRAVLAEGLTLANALDIDLTKTLEVLRAGVAYSKVMDTKGEKMIHRDFTVEARLAQHLKDVRLMLQASGDAGIQLPLSQLHEGLLAQLANSGFADVDNSAIIEAFQRRGE